jgi:aspartate/methionine/tyrosine aminotransferase
MAFRFSCRFDDLELDLNPLEQAKEAYLSRVQQGKTLPWLNLTGSNPTQAGFEPDVTWLDLLAEMGQGPYAADPQGHGEARKALSQWSQSEGRSTSAENFYLTSGTSEAYGLLFKLLTNPGDALLMPIPSYPLIDGLAALEGLTWIPVPLIPELKTELTDVNSNRTNLTDSNVPHDSNETPIPGNRVNSTHWILTVQNLESALTRAETTPTTVTPLTTQSPALRSKVKALILIQPNNPTGSGFTRAEASEIEDFCLRHDLVLILDEVFSPYRFTSDLNSSKENAGTLENVFCHPDLPRFRLNGLSKMLGLPQAKLGWIEAEGPTPWLSQVKDRLTLLTDAYLSVGGPIQDALPYLLNQAAELQKRFKKRIRENLTHFIRTTQGNPVVTGWIPQGGWTLPLSIQSKLDDEDAAIQLLRDQGVLVQPGYFYGFDEADCDAPGRMIWVISLLTPTEDFKEGLRRILAWAEAEA